jgi:hypothetical protein
MKKILFTLLFSFAMISLFAQAKKYPLALHFTNSNCSNCAGSNPAFFKKLDVYPKDVHHISVHPSFPYTSCVFYSANVTDNTLLTNKYNAGSTPSFSLNGAATSNVSTATDAQLKTAIAEKSPISIVVTENKGATRSVKAVVKTVGTVPAANYIVYAAVVEKVVNQKTGNGETTHRDVLRKIVSASAGDAFTPAALNAEKTLNFTYAVDSKWIEAQIYTIVWIQNGNNVILNSGTQFDTTVGTNDILTDETVKIYPNPTKDVLTVDLTNISAIPQMITLINVDGREVAKIKAQKDINSLNISELADGFYTILVQTDHGVLSYNCLKN